jgi:MFS family permease
VTLSANENERRVLLGTCFGHGMTHLYMLVFPALVMPIRSELGLGLGDALELAFMGYLLYGLCALPAGIIADRWSARWMLVACLALSGSGAALVGMSRSPTMLAVALAVVGIGASIYHPTGMALISRTFHHKRGRALGLNGVFGNVGLASAPFISGILASLFGWRSAYLLLAAPGLLGAMWVAAMPVDEDAGEPASSKVSPSVSNADIRRYFVVLCVAMTLGGLAYRASSLVMPSYFELRASFLTPVTDAALGLLGAEGNKTAAATTLTSLVYLMGIVGQMIGGRVADAQELRVSYLVFHLCTLPPLAAMVWLAEAPLLFAAMLYVMFSLGMQPIENSLVAKLTPAAWRSTAYGLKFILTFGIGAFSVTLVGAIERSSGLASVFAAVAALEVMLVMVASSLWLLSRRQLVRLAN